MKSKFIVLCIGFLITLSGCTEGSENVSAVISPTPTTEESIPTQTMESTLTPPKESIPTSTLHPVLSDGEAKALVLDKLKTNVNCELPCWWGIVPGQTSKDEAASFLNQFSNLSHTDISPNYIAFNDVIDPPGIYFHFIFSYNLELVETVTIITGQRNEPYITPTKENRLKYLAVMDNYRLENILSNYGEPDQIWIRSFSPSPNWFDTQTLLLYLDLGTVFLYSSESSAFGNEPMYTATCPNLSNIMILLFDPQSESSLDSIFQFVALHKFMELGESTNIDISEFFNIFQSNKCEQYLLTPSDLWPYEYDDS